MALATYMVISLPAVYMFGTGINNSFLSNMYLKPIWASHVLSFCFLILITCHIPYLFFACKESFLVIVDELYRKQMSKTLEEKLKKKKMGDNSTKKYSLNK